MPNNLVDAIENEIIDAIHGKATFPAVTGTPKLRLLTVNGTDSTAGTQVTGGTYAAQNVTFGSAAAGSIANSALVRFEGLPAAAITGVELWDNANTRRLWHAPLSGGTVNVTANQPLEFGVGTLTFALD